MRLAVCLVFLASFALVCQGQGYKAGYTRPVPRPFYGSRPTIIRPVSPSVTGCSSCFIISYSEAVACCRRLGRCCSALKG
uniref:Penaeidin 5 n=1 Tax=Penaeus merguiensis TaxID=71412 RepID=A0A4D6NV58_PENME|nr:penaeidin 5 [Penaeus merguiensis]QCE43599.1 penaeidin 5 [Penaeus merguiensis]